MEEALIQWQEQELTQTGHYYKHICWMVVPLLWMSCYFYGPRPLLLCGVALLVGNLCDRLISLLRRRVYQPKDYSNESFALIIALLMPATVDWYVLVAAVLAGVLIGKEVFGGYSSYPFHPAAVGYVVAAVSWPEQVFRYPQPLREHPALGCLRRGRVQHHLGHPAQRRHPQHQHPFPGAGRVRGPHGNGCRPGAGGLRAVPLGAERHPPQRDAEFPHHQRGHRVPVSPAGGSGQRPAADESGVPPALCAGRAAHGCHAVQRRVPPQRAVHLRPPPAGPHPVRCADGRCDRELPLFRRL